MLTKFCVIFPDSTVTYLDIVAAPVSCVAARPAGWWTGAACNANIRSRSVGLVLGSSRTRAVIERTWRAGSDWEKAQKQKHAAQQSQASSSLGADALVRRAGTAFLISRALRPWAASCNVEHNWATRFRAGGRESMRADALCPKG